LYSSHTQKNGDKKTSIINEYQMMPKKFHAGIPSQGLF